MIFPPLPCARKLRVRGIGQCPPDVTRFRFSCLFCRMRRAYAGKYVLPKAYVEYTYTSFCFAYPLKDGRFLLRYPYVLIDPRGHFTKLRTAAIVVLDKIIALARRVNKHPRHGCKPWVEFAEFLANFPV